MMTKTKDNLCRSRCVDNFNNNVQYEQIGNTFYLYVEPHQIEDIPSKSTSSKGRIWLYLIGTICMLMFTIMYTMLSVIIWLVPSYQMNQIISHFGGNGDRYAQIILRVFDDAIPRIVTGILMIHVTVCYGYYYYNYNNDNKGIRSTG